jgi:hypothetical protein
MNRKRKRLARATTLVRVGRTVIKTLRLRKKGRRVIKPGRSKRITLELGLPSGEKYKKALKSSHTPSAKRRRPVPARPVTARVPLVTWSD